MKTLSPAVITLPWRQDAAEFYFSRLSHLPWAMLLHSGYADHPYSRFDIVVAEPICTLTTFGKETVVSESEKRTTTTDDPLQVLQQVLDRADIRPTHNEDLPFQGGALGLFGYDLGRRFRVTARNCGTRYRSAGYGSGYLRLGAHCRPPASYSFFAES